MIWRATKAVLLWLVGWSAGLGAACAVGSALGAPDWAYFFLGCLGGYVGHRFGQRLVWEFS